MQKIKDLTGIRQYSGGGRQYSTGQKGRCSGVEFFLHQYPSAPDETAVSYSGVCFRNGRFRFFHVPNPGTRIIIEKIFSIDKDDQCMKRVFIVLLICLAFFFIMGCCNAPPARPQSYYNESSKYPVPGVQSSINYTMVPGPTETIPSMYDVNIETYKNPLASDPYISVTFRGGLGQMYTQSMNAAVLRSDNIFEYNTVSYPAVGSQILLNGTTGTDRLVVEIIQSNQKYRVVDQLMPLKTYG